MKKSTDNGNKIGRDADSGRNIPVSVAERRPKTTVVETRTPLARERRSKKLALLRWGLLISYCPFAINFYFPLFIKKWICRPLLFLTMAKEMNLCFE